MKRRYLLLLPCVTVVAACKVTKTYQPPATDTVAQYRGQSLSDTMNIARLPWRSYFQDEDLQALIAEGLGKNLQLKAAITRIEAANVAYQQSKAAFLPQAGFNAGYKQSRLAYPQGFGFVTTTPQYDMSLSASWEADIWGRLRSAKKAAYISLLSGEAARDVILTRLIADIAGHYYTLLVLDHQLTILEKAADIRSADVEAMTELQRSNVVNGAAVVQSQANEYAARVAIPVLKKQIRQTENALSILLGKPAGDIKRGRLEDQLMPVMINSGVPAQLLANRPDVRQAELAFRGAFESTNIARTAFYPSLTLTAAGGFSSFSFGDWLTKNTGLFGNVAAGVFQPIYNRGQNKSRLKVAKAEQQTAFYNFQQSLLTAGQEVSDALFTYSSVEERKAFRSKQIEALEKSVDFTQTLLKYSSNTNYIDVLTSEQSLLSAQLEQANDQLEQWMAVISLYHALGGGWQ
ncbi:efflux transporter outer membrane subunit [Chitinophaga pinensis]|uniref:RND efflux system, outer membrane lipoprotein, NodT family n=1 Tax=Chitinophaga pinensis (strain ATCC 43595 / DSM 2588 / LMG 13176 / NBRC 15968 / NCIMB 11800 / UQM 2034) TaxID=485918 RepID=A0A979G7C2_CHIPD|nr:efflux transporter outer membrane subunit [Chitinophaga pinensis]ACU62234.1 RND efflux system, outer membrane lipoprotein, NodT family [Chitinophaga pinensis DSM 2588]